VDRGTGLEKESKPKKLVGKINERFSTIFTISYDFPLKDSYLLDSASSIHVSHDRQRFNNFRRPPPAAGHYALCGSGTVTIFGYGDVDVLVTNQRGRKRILRLHNVAYCPEFPTNIVSLQLLEDRGIDWKHREGDMVFRGDPEAFGNTRRMHGQYVIEYNENGTTSAIHAVLNTSSSDGRPKRFIPQSKTTRQPAWANSTLWHRRMGHIGPTALSHLVKQTLGVRIRGPSTSQCQDCALAKITQQISRRPDPNKSTIPFQQVHIDWFDLEEGWDGYQGDGRIVQRCVLIICEATGKALGYFTTSSREDENLTIIKDTVNWLKLRYNLPISVVRSDSEMNRNKTKAWLNDRGITFERCAPDTHDQNGIAESMGRIIMAKARAMRLSGRLPHALWREIVSTAIYLYNRTPRYSLGWKSPYEAFHDHVMTSQGVTGPRKPILHHLKAYGCKCYTLIKSTGDPDYPVKLQKLAPRAHIGYLVGYESTNIYRVWIPHKKKVISTRDVIFNEEQFFDGKPMRLTNELMTALDEAIESVELPPETNQEDIQLRPDNLEPISNLPEETPENINDREEVRDDEMDVDKDSGAEAWEPVYPTPPPSVHFTDISLPVKSEGVKVMESAFAIQTNESIPDLPSLPDIEPAIISEIERQQTERFYDYHQFRVPQVWHTAFQAGRYHKRDVPPPPKNYRELKGHRFEQQFREDMEKHINEHVNQFKSWTVVNHKEANGHQILGCQWIFVYKTDKHGRLLKCKARLVALGNQQHECDLPTRATTLAMTSLRVLLAMVAKFDLETLQLDAVNAFVHADLDELVYMTMPPGFAIPSRVLRLNKALYGLRRSPLLWQTKFTSALKDLGFTEVPQEPCVVLKDGIICFFFVDDIVFAYRKKDKDKVTQIVNSLKKTFTMTELGELKWFLGMHVIRDRSKRSLWISQLSYIEKIAHQFTLNLQSCPETPMAEEELMPLPLEEEVDEADRTLYQQKIGSLLFAGISTRPDIAFATARLSRFNQRPGKTHHEAADRVIRYLYRTRYLSIQYGRQSTATSLVCASDASFADNQIDRKSSQGYIMKLFGGPIAWRANKQDTVTTSSTEAELLALTQTAKEAIYLSRLLRALTLQLDEPLTIQCDNIQTIRLMVQEAAKLQTKLRHVDIHSHWLRQEVQRGTIGLQWQETGKMIADGLTKALSKLRFKRFTEMVGLEDLTERLTLIRRQEDLKDELQEIKSGEKEEITVFTYSRHLDIPVTTGKTNSNS
jgi:hypothetical protein